MILLPPDLPDEIRCKLEALAQKNPTLAQAVLKAWEAKQAKEIKEASAPKEQATEPRSQADSQTDPLKRPISPLESNPPTPTTPPGSEAPQRQSERPVEKTFEWQDLLSKAETTIQRYAHWERLGPLAPMVRLLVAHAIRFGARLDPSRECHIFLAQWELAAALEISERTLERWLNDPRYEAYRQAARMWISWETWYTEGEGIGKSGAVRGGTVWRVRVRPLARPRKVLAPYLRVPWRDLGEDKRKGRTSKILSLPDSMSGYKEALKVGKGLTLQGVVGKPLATLIQKNPVTNHLDPDTAKTARDLRALLRASSIPGGRDGRRSWAQQVASTIAGALGDGHSARFWLRAVWAALKAILFGGGEGALRLLLRVTYMAKEAKEDGFARSPGAYAQALLRREGFWDLVTPFQAFKVGVAA
jgi:hypothetical protein